MTTRVQNILTGIVASDRVAGAYIFLGPPGAGKRAAAEQFAHDLKCLKQDTFVVEPDGASFKIEQVRELQKWVAYGPSASPFMVVIINQADKLTDQAAGAFLKTLEEPAPGVVFVLLVEREDKLPPTIKSRCQQIIFAESSVPWVAKDEFKEFYQAFRGLRGQSADVLLSLSARLAKEKERIEELLYEISFFLRFEVNDLRSVRTVLDSVKLIKRRANLKLTLDLLCLDLGEKGYHGALSN